MQYFLSMLPVLLIGVIPRFVTIFQNAKLTLPLPTQMLLDLSRVKPNTLGNTRMLKRL